MTNVSILVEGLDHPECVAWAPDGTLFAGGEAGQLYRIDVQARTVDEFASTGGFILGLATDGAGNLVACDAKRRAVLRVDPGGAIEVLSTGTPAHALETPNAMAYDAQGNLYVSDSGSWADGGGGVIRIDPAGVTTDWNRGPFGFANGVAISPDQAYLYVVESTLPGVSRVPIRPDGSAGAPEPVVALPNTVPDGIAFDVDGRLYISCYRPDAVYVREPDGELRTLAEDWQGTLLSAPTNIAFGGAGLTRLFAANLGRWHVAEIEVGAPGLPLHHPVIATRP
jgi:gluconolactonase